MTNVEKATEFAKAMSHFNRALEEQSLHFATRKPLPIEPAAERLEAALRAFLENDK